VIDFLVTLDEIDKGKIIVTGHSRGGKAALLAGALDDRAALTVRTARAPAGRDVSASPGRKWKAWKGSPPPFPTGSARISRSSRATSISSPSISTRSAPWWLRAPCSTPTLWATSGPTAWGPSKPTWPQGKSTSFWVSLKKIALSWREGGHEHKPGRLHHAARLCRPHPAGKAGQAGFLQIPVPGGSEGVFVVGA